MKPANLTGTLLTRKGQAQPTLISPPRSAGPIPVGPPPSLTLPLLRTKEPAPDPMPDVRRDRMHTDLTRHILDRRIHMSLRLDPGRHLRLRIEASRTGRSMQSLLLQALDEYLERDGPGTNDGAASRSTTRARQDSGSRREPGQLTGAETDGGSSQSR